MTRAASLLLAGIAAFATATQGRAQTAPPPHSSVVPQPAEGTKTPPPAQPQPGATVGSAADAPAVAAQADSQPVVTPGQSAAAPQGQPKPVIVPPSPGSDTMPTTMTGKTPEPSRKP